MTPASVNGDEFVTGEVAWNYGIDGGLGYFSFRDSLFIDIDPDPPGNLSDDWGEIYIKPWISLETGLGNGELFGKASFAYARTGDDASEIAGGSADSWDFDALYLGWRYGDTESGIFEVSGGRLDYILGKSFLVNDGYSDGGSRGGYWSNPRTAWAPGINARFQHSQHTAELFYLERDERPESDTESRLGGINYQWSPAATDLVLGASYLSLKANELEPQRDGADVWNLRLYTTPFDVPLSLDAEWVYEDNGHALDANAWYLQPYWTWDEARWPTVLYYRYAYFEGDDPDTPANEDYDPLFPGFHDWGSWWQGEIAGEYLISNSNLVSHMLRLHTNPTARIGTGLIYFDFSLDQPGSYQGGVQSDELGQEINWYMDWDVHRMFTLSLVLARTEPGRAVEEAFNRTKPFKYAMVYLFFNY